METKDIGNRPIFILYETTFYHANLTLKVCMSLYKWAGNPPLLVIPRAIASCICKKTSSDFFAKNHIIFIVGTKVHITQVFQKCLIFSPSYRI